MPNLHKESRNATIIRLFNNGRGLTHRQIAEKFGMNISAVSMVIHRDYMRRLYKATENENCDIGDGENEMDFGDDNESSQ